MFETVYARRLTTQIVLFAILQQAFPNLTSLLILLSSSFCCCILILAAIVNVTKEIGKYEPYPLSFFISPSTTCVLNQDNVGAFDYAIYKKNLLLLRP